jgi:hypothetical protein
MAAEIFAPFTDTGESQLISFEKKVRWLCERKDYTRALRLCLQTLKTISPGEPLMLDPAFIIRAAWNLRKLMPAQQFREIAQQFNMDPDCFARPDPDDIEGHKETVDEFLASLTQVVLEAVEQPGSETELAGLRSLIRHILSQLPDDPPKYLDIRPYFLFLYSMIEGDDFRERRKKMPRRFRRLFDRVKKGEPYRKKGAATLKLQELARKIHGP